MIVDVTDFRHAITHGAGSICEDPVEVLVLTRHCMASVWIQRPLPRVLRHMRLERSQLPADRYLRSVDMYATSALRTYVTCYFLQVWRCHVTPEERIPDQPHLICRDGQLMLAPEYEWRRFGVTPDGYLPVYTEER